MLYQIGRKSRPIQYRFRFFIRHWCGSYVRTNGTSFEHQLTAVALPNMAPAQEDWRVKMKTLLLLSLVALLSAELKAQSTHTDIQNRFVGSWRLASLEEPRADGYVQKAECDGMFVFTSDGKAAVQVIYRSAPSGSAYTQGGVRSFIRQLQHRQLFDFHISHRPRTCANAHWQRPEAQV